MTKIRMNTEFRNKILNRYVDHAEKENTQEREAYLQSIEQVDELYQQGKALEYATNFGVDEVIDPAESRTWIKTLFQGKKNTQKKSYLDVW